MRPTVGESHNVPHRGSPDGYKAQGMGSYSRMRPIAGESYTEVIMHSNEAHHTEIGLSAGKSYISNYMEMKPMVDELYS